MSARTSSPDAPIAPIATTSAPNNGLLRLNSLTANTNTTNNNNNENNNEFVRDVQKAGWLRYLPFAERPSTSAGVEEHRFWVVFAVHNECRPYLEFYQKRQITGTHINAHPNETQCPPVSTHSLHRCQHIAPAITCGDKPFNEFAVTLDTYIIRLVADNQHAMCDWIDSLRAKLRLLNVLPAPDNLYMREPQPLPRQNSIRSNHFRPLPPIPSQQLSTNSTLTPVAPVGPGTSASHNTVANNYLHTALPLTPGPLAPISTPSSSVATPPPLTAQARAASPTEIYEAIFDERQPASLPPPLPPVPPLPHRTLRTTSINDGSSPSTPLTIASLEPLNSHVPSEEGPPPYESIAAVSSTPISLRESQVLRLRKEIAHPSGVRLTVRKKDCYHSIALVDLSDAVWIAGWRQKEFPVLHNTFHIGDQLLSINGDPVCSASQAYKLIKQNALLLEIIVRRVPNARVFCIKRRQEGQELGIVRDGGRAEIVAVIRSGLADKAGLNARAVYGDQECNWSLTEINNRPLNMFFKGQEIEDRLSAVGKEISILVQPFVFVKYITKQLKQLRNFKDYIVQ